jgi:hypothetical protein
VEARVASNSQQGHRKKLVRSGTDDGKAVLHCLAVRKRMWHTEGKFLIEHNEERQALSIHDVQVMLTVERIGEAYLSRHQFGTFGDQRHWGMHKQRGKLVGGATIHSAV